MVHNVDIVRIVANIHVAELSDLNQQKGNEQCQNRDTI